MKTLSRFALMTVLALAALVLRASDLPAYAPKDTNLIIFANLNRIVNSRLAQKIFAENPDLQQQRDAFAKELKEKSGLDWNEMLNSEICFFANFQKLEQPAFQILAISNSGKAGGFFDYCAQKVEESDESEKPSIGKVNGMRIIRDQQAAFLLLDSRMLQLSYSENNPAEVISAPLVKTDLLLAKDVDTGAMLSFAIDVASTNLAEEMKKDEAFKDISHNLNKITVIFSEKGDTLKLTSVATYCDEASAAAALVSARKLAESVKAAPPQSAAESIVTKIIAKDTIEQDGCRVIGTSEMDSSLAIQLFSEMMNQAQPAEQPAAMPAK